VLHKNRHLPRWHLTSAELPILQNTQTGRRQLLTYTLSTFHVRTVLSREAEARWLPSGAKATLITSSV
jgi:hypothetical protein